MIGQGSKCDECGTSVVDPKTDGFQAPFGPARLPAGWFVVYGPLAGQPYLADIEHHLCSTVCLARWSAQAVHVSELNPTGATL